MFGYGENASPQLDSWDAMYIPNDMRCEDGSSPHTSDFISNMMSWAPSQTSNSPYAASDPYSDQSPSPQPMTPPTPTSSVQAARSYLIKAGLKLTIQSKRVAQGLDQIKPEFNLAHGDELTPEDEERRLRRRERNKLAATKCRNKKKERTQRLAKESEFLEANNQYLKDEIQELQREKQELLDLLGNHLPKCNIPSSCNSCAHAQSCSVI